MAFPEGDTQNLWSAGSAAVARTAEATTSAASPSRAGNGDNPTLVPMRRRLVDRLKFDYPQLREHVEGFILAQEWRRVSDVMRLHLTAQKASSGEDDFWATLWDLMNQNMLRSRLPANLANQAEVQEHVTCFREHLDKASEATRSGHNPYQSAERTMLAADIYTHVELMLDAAEELVASCRDDARRLLERLNSCVDEILAGVDEAAPEPATSGRFSDVGQRIDAEAPGDASSSRMGQGSKPAAGDGEAGESYRVEGGAEGADVMAHSIRQTRKET